MQEVRWYKATHKHTHTYEHTHSHRHTYALKKKGLYTLESSQEQFRTH